MNDITHRLGLDSRAWLRWAIPVALIIVLYLVPQIGGSSINHKRRKQTLCCAHVQTPKDDTGSDLPYSSSHRQHYVRRYQKNRPQRQQHATADEIGQSSKWVCARSVHNIHNHEHTRDHRDHQPYLLCGKQQERLAESTESEARRDRN